MPLIMFAVQTYCHPTVDEHFVFGIDHIAGLYVNILTY